MDASTCLVYESYLWDYLRLSAPELIADLSNLSIQQIFDYEEVIGIIVANSMLCKNAIKIGGKYVVSVKEIMDFVSSASWL